MGSVVDVYEEDGWLVERIEHRHDSAKSSISKSFLEYDRLTRISNLEVIMSTDALDTRVFQDTRVYLQYFFYSSLAMECCLADQMKKKRISHNGEECIIPLFGTNWIQGGKLVMLPSDLVVVELNISTCNPETNVIRGLVYTKETFLRDDTSQYQQTLIYPELHVVRPFDTTYHGYIITSGVPVMKTVLRRTNVLIFIPNQESEFEMESIIMQGVEAKVLPLKTSNSKTWGYAFGFSEYLDGQEQFRNMITRASVQKPATLDTVFDLQTFYNTFSIVFNFTGTCTSALLHTLEPAIVHPLLKHMFL